MQVYLSVPIFIGKTGMLFCHDAHGTAIFHYLCITNAMFALQKSMSFTSNKPNTLTQ